MVKYYHYAFSWYMDIIRLIVIMNNFMYILIGISLLKCVCVCIIINPLMVGFFMEPTIFTEVEDEMFVAKEESFGPVMIISVFEDG